MSDRYPANVRQMNSLLRSELGANPLYSWRWSEDLWHVLEVLDLDGNPLYVEGRSPAGLVIMVPKTDKRPLLPMHHNQWILCGLVEVNAKDGTFAGTGDHAWVPVASASGVVCLAENEKPNLVFTQSVIDIIRQSRTQTVGEMTQEWEDRERKRERDRWNRIYDEIRNEATAFLNIPGMKAHVSFPNPHLVN